MIVKQELISKSPSINSNYDDNSFSSISDSSFQGAERTNEHNTRIGVN